MFEIRFPYISYQRRLSKLPILNYYNVLLFKVYLAVPLHQSLTRGHCLIIPMEHVTSSLMVDEDVWSEIQVGKQNLMLFRSSLLYRQIMKLFCIFY